MSPEVSVKEVLEMMQVPFPALTDLDLSVPEGHVLDLPDRFLGGSVPSLQHLRLEHIAFPGLPQLLLLARNLVSLQLEYIPATGDSYISPEAMVGGLDGLTRLRTLYITFRPAVHPRRQRSRIPIPPMRSVLPALTEFVFKGENEYSEDLVTQIDTPGVEDLRIDFFMQEVETCQLPLFINRTANLELAQFRTARVIFGFRYASIQLYHPQRGLDQARLSFTTYLELDSPIPYMTRILGQLVAMLSSVGHLSIHGAEHEELGWRPESMDNTECLPLLHLFPAVEALLVTGGVAGHIASALQDIAEERVNEVLPALHLLQLGDGNSLVGLPGRFLSFRQLSGRPVTVVVNDSRPFGGVDKVL